MDKRCVELTFGGLLHDIGKVLYRDDGDKNHSIRGSRFLEELGVDNQQILDQVRYHHKVMVEAADLSDDHLAYITYWANQVAAASENQNGEDAGEADGETFVPLFSIFNILNGNHQSYAYPMEIICDQGKANMPEADVKQYAPSVYSCLVQNLKEGISAIKIEQPHINSLLSLLEANLSYAPCSLEKGQPCDISLYDHCKITAAIAGCAYNYFTEENVKNFRQHVFESESCINKKKIFQLVSMDISGIQEYIFMTATKDALKTLRAKSFYLEIMLEHIVDELLERIGLSRANLIYSGGGHAYLLVDHTSKTNEIISRFNQELKTWYLDNFKTELFIAIGQEPCCANDLMNKPDGAYKRLFQNVSRKVSKNKSMRYDADEILSLNQGENEQYARECKLCGTLNQLNDEALCPMCDSLIHLSKDILKKPFISILCDRPKGSSVKLPFDRYMVMEDESEFKRRKTEDAALIRSYSKNRLLHGENVSTKVWTGDYHLGETFHDLAEASTGIKRLGILRADVDNLGRAFVSGFEGVDGSQQYVSLSRSATFSRKMSMFFKLHLNHILAHGSFSLDGTKEDIQRNMIVIYSGGDDLFLVGAWDDILGAAIDIQAAFEKFCQNTLSISAGIGLFPEKYPVRALARETGALEDAAKDMDGKNAITIFDEQQTYKWSTLKENILGEKYQLIEEYFRGNPDKGMSALYHLLEYIRNKDEKINIARFAYLLGRMEPDKKAPEETKELYQKFAKKMYQWIKDEEDSKMLITAIYIYVYLNRKREGQDGSFN